MPRQLPNSNRPWLPVSAAECTASASNELEPVRMKPTNLATPIPALAMHAAMTAFCPLAMAGALARN